MTGGNGVSWGKGFSCHWERLLLLLTPISNVDLSLIIYTAYPEFYVAYSYVCLHGSASQGAMDLTFCYDWVVPRVMTLVFHGLLDSTHGTVSV